MTETVLITGGAGFIGIHLSQKLLEEDYEVVCLDNFCRFSENRVKHLLDYDNFELVTGDIRDGEIIADVMQGIDTVYHLAAQSNVQGAMENKDYSFETNVVGTWNVLRAAEECGVEKILFASSREVYGDVDDFVSEEASLQPKNFYGASKAAAEQYTQQFNEHTSLAAVSLRLANVYGPGDKDRVIPIFLEKAKQNEELILYGGEQVLDFVWIEDVVQAFMTAMDSDFNHDVMNVGSGRGTSIRELAHLIKDITESSADIIEQESRNYDTEKFIADNSRMENCGMKPTMIKKGIKKLVEMRGGMTGEKFT